jgi:hypothetical protein
LCPQWEKRTIRHTTGQINDCDFNQGRSIVKKFWLCATLIAFWPALGFAQTTDELVNDGKNTENVTTQSMGYDRKSYSPLKQINKSNVKRLVPLWSTSLMSDQGELAAPTIYNGVMYVINGKWTFAIDVETEGRSGARPCDSNRRAAAPRSTEARRRSITANSFA